MNRLFLVFGVLWCCLRPAAAQSLAYQFLDDEAEPHTNLTFALRLPAATPQRGGLTIVFDYQNSNNFYALDLTSGSARLRAVANGKARVLASAAATLSATSQVTLQRRPWLMQVVVDNGVVLTAYDVALTSGRIGMASSGGWGWQNPRVQPVEEQVYFTDDFTRGAQEAASASEWKAAAGRWELTSSSDNITRRNIEMSANPFSYRVQAPGARGFAQAGRWFWDNYLAGVSVRPGTASPHGGSVGLAVYVRDARNYLALLWSADEGPEARRLVRVVDGKTTVLARAPGAYLPRQWYRLGVRTSPGTVEAFIDGQPVFRVRENAFGQGAIGLLAENVTGANFDDARVESYAYYAQDFSGGRDASLGSGAWQPIGGIWRAANGVLQSAAVRGDGGATRVLLAGASDWDGYEIAASGRVGGAGACGIMGGYRDNKNYTAFRWAGPDSKLPFRGRQQLLRYHNGKALTLSDEPATVLGLADGNGFTRVRLRFASGVVTVYAGDEIVAQAADEGIEAGKPGLWAQSTVESAFRDVVLFFPPEPEKPKVAPKMEDDAHMVGWASPSGEWPPAQVQGRREYWNTGDFYGDAWIELPWRRTAYAAGNMEVALRARRERFTSGYLLRCEASASTGYLKLTLSRNTRLLKQVEVNLKELGVAETPAATPTPAAGSGSTPAEPGLPLRIELEGRAILVRAAGRPVLSFLDIPDKTQSDTDEAPGAPTCIAVRSAGFEVPARELRAFSSHRDDYTFTEAPIDWYAPQGDWSVFSRWPCYSDWSFFGGKGLAPVLWNKRVYRGDVVVEMYAHNQMDLPKEIGYSRPGDLNITIAGDGKNPASGYSFIVAGWSNTRTRVYKGTQLVAENTSAKARFPRPINHNAGFHKRWYYIRAEARHTRKDGENGVQLRLLIDDEVLAEYFDPQPLPALSNGGRVALWTVNSAIMVARAKIESAGMGGRVLPAGLLDALPVNETSMRSGENGISVRPLLTDDVPSSIVEPAEAGWTVRNPASGGRFAVQIKKNGGEPWKVGRDSRLEMELSLPPEAKVDCYVVVNETLHLVTLTGAQRPDARAPLLGAAWDDSRSTPGMEPQWRRVSFALGEALKKQYPEAASWDVEAVLLGALHGDEYRWAGFNGNALGTSYWVRDVRVTE